MSPTRIHQHPLAYLLGTEGIALMRAYAGEHDRDFTRSRIAGMRRLLDQADGFGDGVDLEEISMAEGYDSWAPAYDNPDNGFFAMDEAAMLPILDTIPAGDAVDAMCGTGRYAEHLAERGHRVRGYDVSPGMLDVARAKVPEAEFDVADVTSMPVQDASADVMVNALAINHVEDLGPAFAEAARILRPGGHLLLCSMAGYFLGSRFSPMPEYDARGNIGYIQEWNHSTGDYLRAALAAGLVVRDCQELTADVSPDENTGDPELPQPGLPMSIWQLHRWVPEAAHAVRDDRVCLTVWHFTAPE
ncbi:MAG: class I SAM-dependent methyltransferase [Nocardioides sp.]|nr:class I SAM-dependent methyltransferase [Nocardioides sp.]